MTQEAFFDPYDQMTDDEFQAHMDKTFGRAPMTSISMRMPFYLLADVKQLAHAHKVPYQQLMKLWIADGVASMQRRGTKPTTTTTAARRVSTKAAATRRR
jgi:predicted DNA binding CopG/RHH family protein